MTAKKLTTLLDHDRWQFVLDTDRWALLAGSPAEPDAVAELARYADQIDDLLATIDAKAEDAALVTGVTDTSRIPSDVLARSHDAKAASAAASEQRRQIHTLLGRWLADALERPDVIGWALDQIDADLAAAKALFDEAAGIAAHTERLARAAGLTALLPKAGPDRSGYVVPGFARFDPDTYAVGAQKVRDHQTARAAG